MTRKFKKKLKHILDIFLLLNTAIPLMFLPVIYCSISAVLIFAAWSLTSLFLFYLSISEKENRLLDALKNTICCILSSFGILAFVFVLTIPAALTIYGYGSLWLLIYPILILIYLFKN